MHDLLSFQAQKERREIAMVTEAQKRANAAYRKKSVKQLTMRFYPSDEDEVMYAWLKSQENTTEYLKALVRADMEKSAE